MHIESNKMKKIVLSIALLFTAAIAFGQNKYVSVGAGYSNHQYSEGIEAGYFNSNLWLGGLVSVSKDPGSSHFSTFVGPKVYERLFSVGIVDVFVYEGAYIGLDNTHQLEFEPGLSPVINLSKNWALQISGSVPLYTKSSGPSYPSTGLSINYFF